MILIPYLIYGQGNGLYKFQSENGKYGFMDKHGKIKIKAKYLHVNDFDGGLCRVSKEIIETGYKWITLDTLGKKTNSRVKTFSLVKNDKEFKSDKFVPFQKNQLWGFKNNQNRVIIEPKFYKIDKFENGVCAVRINKVQFEFSNDFFFDALIDENGRVLIEIEMHCFMGFQGDLIEFYGGPHFTGGIYYLNRNGKRINPTE